jgi:signal transduction histidine kinase
VLDDFGLVAALEWQLREFERRSGLECRFASSADQIDLDRERATAVFRIFQEALTNISRHANATQVDVTVEHGPDWLALRIQDNGDGIAPERLANPDSFGLASMRERARLLAGELSIAGGPAQGTTVMMQVPLDGRRISAG